MDWTTNCSAAADRFLLLRKRVRNPLFSHLSALVIRFPCSGSWQPRIINVDNSYQKVPLSELFLLLLLS